MSDDELTEAHRNASIYAITAGIKVSTSETVRDLLLRHNPVTLAGRKGKARAGMRWLCVEVAEDVAALVLKQEDPGAAVSQSVRREYEMAAGG